MNIKHQSLWFCWLRTSKPLVFLKWKIRTYMLTLKAFSVQNVPLFLKNYVIVTPKICHIISSKTFSLFSDLFFKNMTAFIVCLRTWKSLIILAKNLFPHLIFLAKALTKISSSYKKKSVWDFLPIHTRRDVQNLIWKQTYKKTIMMLSKSQRNRVSDACQEIE